MLHAVSGEGKSTVGRLETSKLLKRSVLRVAEMFARRTHFQLSLSEFNTENAEKSRREH